MVDPRATPTAAASTLHLQITPGTDAALANGLLHIAMKEGYLDDAFIAARTTASTWFDGSRRRTGQSRVERITGIPRTAVCSEPRACWARRKRR